MFKVHDTGTLKVKHRGYTIRSVGDFQVEILAPEPDGGPIGWAPSVGEAEKIVDQMEGVR